MCMECGHIVQERAILTADAPVEVFGQNVRSIMCVYKVWSHCPGESYPHC